jgi:glycosyltransferase involved in cell wall biosynthesis
MDFHSPKKRLAIFLPELIGGGAQRVMLNLAQGIADNGYSVDLIVSKAIGPYLAEVPKNIRLVNLKSSGVVASLPALLSYLYKEKPDALLSSLHANIIAVFAKMLLGFPGKVVVSQHDTVSLSSQMRKNVKGKLMPHLIKYFYPRADCIVAVSKGVADQLSELTRIERGKIHVIFNPIITRDIQEKMDEPINHPWFKPAEPPVILGVGSLSTVKDFSSLIKAFDQVRKTRYTRLIILGEGSQRLELEQLVKDLDLAKDVLLPGFLQNPYAYMRRCSLFILSSKFEGLPTVLVEALYCGIPVISTDCPSGPREILADGKYGMLVPVGDIPSMVQAIQNGLDGNTPRPTPESWLSYKQDIVEKKYLEILFDGDACNP